MRRGGDSSGTNGMGDGAADGGGLRKEACAVAEDRGKLMKTAIVKPVVQFTGGERFFIVLPKNLEDLTY